MYTEFGQFRSWDDETFVKAFEDLRLEPECFSHADHVRLAFIYLDRFDLVEAMGRFRSALRAFTAHAGLADKYHETVTMGLLVLIHERMAVQQPENWDTFAAANTDLLRWKDGAFFEYYSPDVLDSDLARRVFVLPS